GSGPATSVADVPIGTRVEAGDVAFSTLDEVQVWPVEAHAAIRVPPDGPLDDDASVYVSRSAGAVGRPLADVSTYATKFGAKEPSKPGRDTLDPSSAIEDVVFVALLGEPGVDLGGMGGGTLSIGFAPAHDVPTMEARADQPCPGAGEAPTSPSTQWQICTTMPRPDAADPDTADPIWLDLPVVGDSTAGLTVPGVVRLELPPSLDDVGLYLPGNPDAAGAGEQPPLVENDEMLERLVAWMRVFRPGGGELPAVDWIDTNAARVEQSVAAGAEFVGTGTGEPSQRYSLVNGNVLGGLRFEVEEIGAPGWIGWTRVDDFSASGVDDRHVVVDAEAGTVSCGDGRRGRVWQIGERLRVRSYRHGGGAAGNVAVEAISSVGARGPTGPPPPSVPQVHRTPLSNVTVANPLPTRGGADAEGLAAAIDRIPSEFRRHDRAVTASDFSELGRATPGAGIARAETLRLFHPLTPDVEAPGVVSVVVWPDHDRRNPNAPRPDRPTLDAVCRYLDERRLVTTELYVIPPTYRRISVSVGVQVGPGAGSESVRRWVELVLRQFLAPLPPYGPGGAGWPLGRRVFAPELEAAAVQVDGVEFLVPGPVPGSDCLAGLRLAEWVDGDGWVERASRAIELDRWEVPELAAITVVQGEPLDPTDSIEPGAADAIAVPVRTTPEVC
ncbi:MAG: putative baseplate assembly protein, partial [Actinomycetota bacterium]